VTQRRHPVAAVEGSVGLASPQLAQPINGAVCRCEIGAQAVQQVRAHALIHA
jgi:hypothetical protein